MFNRCCFALVASLFLSGLCVAQENPSTYEHLKPMEWIIGDWQWDGEWRRSGEEPEPFVYHASFKWVLGKNFIEQTTSRMKSDGQSEVVQKGMIAWDSADEIIVGWGFWRDYAKFEQVNFAPLEGDRVRVTRPGLDGMFEQITDNSFRYGATFEEDDGSEGSWSLKATRITTTIPSEIRAAMDSLVGDWTTEGTFAGSNFTGTYTAKWGPGRHCLILKSSEENRERFTGVGGYDPTTSEYVETWYGAAGTRIESRYRIDSASEWSGKAIYQEPSGARRIDSIQLSKKGEGEFVFTAENPTEGTKYRVRTTRANK